MDDYYEPDSLFQAVSNNDLPQIKKLIASKCNVNEVDEIEGPVLSLALADSNPDIEIVKVLLTAQADPNLHTDIYQHTPFQEYSRHCHPDPKLWNYYYNLVLMPTLFLVYRDAVRFMNSIIGNITIL